MCMCRYKTGSSNVNGTPGYSWNGEEPHIRPLDPPPLAEGDKLIFDGPGRCGGGLGGLGIDSHCHHFRLVKPEFGEYALLVENGSGTHRFELGHERPWMQLFKTASSDTCYWLLQGLYQLLHDAMTETLLAEQRRWTEAILEKRIKIRSRGKVKYVQVLPEEAK